MNVSISTPQTPVSSNSSTSLLPNRQGSFANVRSTSATREEVGRELQVLVSNLSDNITGIDSLVPSPTSPTIMREQSFQSNPSTHNMHHSASQGTITDTSSNPEENLSEVSVIENQELSEKSLNIVERIPLACKLIIMGIVTLLGVLLIGSLLIKDQAVTLHGVASLEGFMELNRQFLFAVVPSVRHERSLSISFLLGQASMEQLIESRKESDVALNLLHQLVQGYGLIEAGDAISAEIKRAMDKEDLIIWYRRRVDERKVTPMRAHSFLSSPIEYWMRVLLVYCSKLNMKKTLLQYQLFLHAIENEQQLQSYGSLIISITNNITSWEVFNRYSDLYGKRNTFLNMFLNVGTDDAVNYYDDLTKDKAEIANVRSYELTILSNPTIPNFGFLIEEFNANATAKFSLYDQVLMYTLRSIGANNEQDTLFAILYIALVGVVCLLSFLLSLVTSYILVKTVVGSWAHANRAQEIAMSRFIPKGLMNLLHCYHISDLAVGQNITTDMTLLYITIENFSHIITCQKLKTETSVPPFSPITLLREYLEHVGPVIHSHHGHIDRYDRDCILAVFKKTTNAVKCTSELLDAIRSFNQSNLGKYPEVLINMSLYYAPELIIAAMGEQKRLQITFLSDDLEISRKLENLCKKFRAKVITTKSTIRKLPVNCKKLLHTRLIGVLEDGLGEQHELLEIIDPIKEPFKVNTKHIFTKAMEALVFKQNYTDAMVKFNTVFKESNQQDRVALYFSRVCDSAMSANRQGMERVLIAQTLRDESLRKSFAQFCENEKSQENIKLWTSIEDFKSFSDFVSRKMVAQKILSEFFSGDLVNLPDSAKTQTLTQLQDALMGVSGKDQKISRDQLKHLIMNNDLFKEIQSSIEFVMSDPHKRFTNTELFKQGFSSSHYATKPPDVIVKMNEQTICWM